MKKAKKTKRAARAAKAMRVAKTMVRSKAWSTPTAIGLASATGAAVTVTTVAVLARRRMSRARREADERWHSVTIAVAPETFDDLPRPLAEFNGGVHVRVRPAPGGRGTELSARTVSDATGARVPVTAIRRALRECRQIVETGDILSPDAPATTRPTLRSRPLAYAARQGKEGGRL